MPKEPEQEKIKREGSKEEIVVEELSFRNIDEIVQLFADAFKDTYFVKIVNSKKDPLLHGFFRASLNLFKNDDNAKIFGIKDNGKVVCSSLISSAGGNLKTIDSIKFIFSLISWIGFLPALRLLKFFFYALSSPSQNKKFIDFILFGTQSGYQQNGLGKKMMDYVYDYTKNKKSEGIILTCVGDSPAYRFYLKEGFKVERKARLYSTTLNFMRKCI